MRRSKPIKATEPSERRRAVRFPADSSVHFRRLGRGKSGETVTGQAIDISSHGIRFLTEEPLTPGTRLLLSVDWPVRLGETCPLQLVTRSRVVRYGGGVAAARFENWEFHTRRPANVDGGSRFLAGLNIE